MASGEVATVASGELAELPRGSVVTSSGRISGVTEPGELSVHYPFPVKDLVRLDDALKFGSRKAKARFERTQPDRLSTSLAEAVEHVRELAGPKPVTNPQVA